VTKGATIREASANSEIGIDITEAITFICPLALRSGELALKQLPPAAD
jgi:hypothetical protein